MFNWILSGAKLTEKQAIFARGCGYFCLGTIFGHLKALNLAGDMDGWANMNNITEYVCEDQINSLIEEKKKPAVIYYSLSKKKAHYLFRSYMMKYSNMYPENAIWVIVNVPKQFEEIRQSFKSISFLFSPFRLEIRYPKKDLSIYRLNPEFKLANVNEIHGHRRQVYNLYCAEWDFKHWLEYYGVIESKDPVNSMLRSTQQALFDPLPS